MGKLLLNIISKMLYVVGFFNSVKVVYPGVRN